MTTLGTHLKSRQPTGLKVAPMSYAKLEEVAEGIWPMLPKLKDRPYFIDAVRVLEHTVRRLKFEYVVALDEEIKDCAAFTVPEERIVVVRQNVYEGLFTGNVFSRSTIIHEISHIALNHAVTLHRGAPAGKHAFYEDSEWQAKTLTGAIMMPIAACKVAMTPGQLAQMCGTSEQAAGYRLKNLTERKVLDPKRFGPGLFDDLT